MISLQFVALLIVGSLNLANAKVFGQCEFANAMRGYGFPESQISTWVCIANYESHFDTQAHNTNSGDWGILQISQIYWCSASGGAGGICNQPCSNFLNDDISDDVACVKVIFDDRQQMSGNGFDAWTTYPAYCNGDTSQWTAGC